MILLFFACNAPLRFDGVDDFVAVEGVENLDGPGLCLEAWVYPEKPTNPKANLIARRDPKGGNDAFTFRIRWDMGGVLELGMASGGREWGMAGHTPVPVDTWTFVALTHDRNQRRISMYVNGRIDTVEQAAIPPGRGDLPLWLGGDPLHGPAGRPYHGQMKDLRIWSVVRSEAEILADMNNTAPLGTAGLVWGR